MSAPAKPYKLEDEPLWREVSDLAEYMYSKLPDFPDEEKWGLVFKLRNTAADFLLWWSLAIGNPGPAGSEHDWAAARKHTAALKTIYRFACRQKCIDLEPAIMVRLDKLLAASESERLQALRELEKHTKLEQQRDLKPWLEKYRIWQQINQEKTT